MEVGASVTIESIKDKVGQTAAFENRDGDGHSGSNASGNSGSISRLYSDS
jgi:hypothetical protein